MGRIPTVIHLNDLNVTNRPSLACHAHAGGVAATYLLRSSSSSSSSSSSLVVAVADSSSCSKAAAAVVAAAVVVLGVGVVAVVEVVVVVVEVAVILVVSTPAQLRPSSGTRICGGGSIYAMERLRNVMITFLVQLATLAILSTLARV